MPSKKKASATEGQESRSADFEDLIEEFEEEEGKVDEIVDGFSKFLDDIYKEGLTFYDVVLVQRVVNAFLMDFIEVMYEGEMNDLIDEIVELSGEEGLEGTEEPAEAKEPKKASKPKKPKRTKK
jgi:flagellar motor component MotA